MLDMSAQAFVQLNATPLAPFLVGLAEAKTLGGWSSGTIFQIGVPTMTISLRNPRQIEVLACSQVFGG